MCCGVFEQDYKHRPGYIEAGKPDFPDVETTSRRKWNYETFCIRALIRDAWEKVLDNLSAVKMLKAKWSQEEKRRLSEGNASTTRAITTTTNYKTGLKKKWIWSSSTSQWLPQ